MTEASITEYATKMENIEKMIIYLLDGKINAQDLIKVINDHNITKNDQDFRILLHLISEISANYNRSRPSFDKMEPFLKEYLQDIKNRFQNFDIFNIFKNNKHILHLLFKEKILIPCKSIFNVITNAYYTSLLYPQFFSPEFNSFYTDEFVEQFDKKEQFKYSNQLSSLIIDEKKRVIGENDSKICQIIRNDDIDELKKHSKVVFSDKLVSKSLYDTYLPHTDKSLSIIEYATFCGAINILQYLIHMGEKFTSNIWIYAVRSNDLKMIQFLEKLNVQFGDIPIEKVINESIICHHNEITKYLMDKYKVIPNVDIFCQSYNFTIMVNSIQNKKINWNDNIFPYYCCKYDYYYFVEFFIKNKKLNANEMIISK